MVLCDDTTINKRVSNALLKKNIVTSDDLVRFVPRKYKDYSKVVTLKEATVGRDNAIRGHFMRSKLKREPGRPSQYIIYLMDEESGTEFKASWLGNTFVSKFYDKLSGLDVVVCGKLTYDNKWGYQISSPDIVEESGGFIPKIMPVYPNIKGVSESNLKTMIYENLKKVSEPLEKDVEDKLNVIDYKDALYKLHYPKTEDDILAGKKRLLSNDLLYFSMILNKNVATKTDGFVFTQSAKAVDFVNQLPFALTQGQKDVLNKAIINAKHGVRNNLLVQGDVGCGKTVVAFTMMVNAVENGYQATLVAPTKILASQHYEEFIQKTGLSDEVAFLHSDLKAAERKAIYKDIKEGKVKYIIGTHSVFNKGVEFNNLGIIITDEEHKFGVKQKEALKTKAETGVHIIAMSATPIPRSLAGVYFGEDKDICIVDTLPEGRIPVQTATQIGHTNTFPFLKKQIEMGHQIYVVCPAIESTSEDDEAPYLKNIEDVMKEYKSYFDPVGVKIAAVHGKMKKDEVEASIEAFTKNEVQILISTTVIEVGVNVPNATVMVVEQADRFGLASLHQLRGRVGRGKDKSYCILISSDRDNERLKTMVSTTNGFEIAEADLNLRGGGDLIGTKQSGFDKYVQMIIANNAFYEQIKEVATYCIDNNMGNKLLELYDVAN